MVAIDYTASNGDPALPSSLHYLDASHATLNPYETVITTVGRIVDQYDSDKLYPVLGFGARVMRFEWACWYILLSSVNDPKSIERQTHGWCDVFRCAIQMAISLPRSTASPSMEVELRLLVWMASWRPTATLFPWWICQDRRCSRRWSSTRHKWLRIPTAGIEIAMMMRKLHRLH